MEHLKKLTNFRRREGPVVLCIMDGVACGQGYEGNAVSNAYTPHLDWLSEHCPNLKLKAHGRAVGMPTDEDMGNSEVGHNAIGSGRVFSQGATLVANSINNGSLFNHSTWIDLIANCKSFNSTLHFIGLLSDGNVHSHINHLLKMVAKAREVRVKRVRIHCLLDGRDVDPTSATKYIDQLEVLLNELNESGADYKIASGGGRMKITMDRYNANWAMVKEGWDVHVRGEGRQFSSAKEAILTYRDEEEVFDQDIPGFVIANNGDPVEKILDNDSVIFFNFRGDRAIELCEAFDDKAFNQFDREYWPKVKFAGMMEYDPDRKVPRKFLVNPPQIDRTLGEYLANAQLRQFAISETQKYGHVTYFFNGNRSAKFSEKLETYCEIKSTDSAFDQRPWMKSAEITDVVIREIFAKNYDFIRINYPNGDMVGHTGNYHSTIIAVEAVDLAVNRLTNAIEKSGGILIVTADHGNADEMIEYDRSSCQIRKENGTPKVKTNHSLNPVPLYIFDPSFQGEYKLKSTANLGISSIAATCLNFLGYHAPEGYDTSILDLN